MTHIIPISSILIEARQRKIFDAVKLNELRHSIRSRKRLLNPIIVQPLTSAHAPADADAHADADGTGFRLICGERRIRAMNTMHEEHEQIYFENEIIPPAHIAATLIEDISLIERLRHEFDENMIRDDLTWQDRDRALFAIHQLELNANPDATISSTAQSLSAKGGIAGAKTPGAVRDVVQQAIVVAQHLHDPVIATARNSNEAYALVMSREEAQINAAIYRKTQGNLVRTGSNPRPPDIRIELGDATKLVPQLPANSFNLILSDPPYGVVAGAAGYRGRTVHHHNYEDSPELGLEALKFLLLEGWRVTKPTANIFIFANINNWDFFKTQAKQIGWKPFIVPIIWQKSLSEGLAPWGKAGFRRTYEAIFFATKGARGLISSPTDILSVRRVHRSERIYGAQKPVDLLIQLIECATLPGDSVLDPFLGSGATLAAVKRSNRIGLGIELDPTVVDIATNFVFKGEIADLEPDGDGDTSPTSSSGSGD